ncbi:MAG: sn-glycerol-3-phosphate import ATP-binding protein UgpC [Alphaproteobacteria bacterium MarineAlpha5_Bin5]|nr:MAG: sn-glycerol-3-phosphate import ATP-binding protein UgpC [Alphaproteobacteria bacterium MarineAlpha5_Bin4]PPR50065.1 MAG: sn-glycerol-3-phosphate import ATP-binding protein UgpC [Alphaproteobacteria bacterium MarineAlpha5_Bin5]|tara:strand:+ start:431 stop:1528 length:1098 start_codon:yes stop_codon:yes gene_type:complete
MANVDLKNLTKKYGEVIAVQNMDLSIPHNEFLVLVGPSGCGKSTTLRMIAGLEEITSGEIYIGDQLVNEKDPKDRNVSMVFQNYALYPHMTVEENLGFSLKIAKVDKNEIETRVKEAVQILGLEELQKRKPSQLSGGQRQRVAMGRAIVRRPDAFLFDEPLSNLDAKLRTQMRTEIKKLHQKLKTTIIYVTHDQVEAMTLADRIIIMKDGYIEQIGSPIEVFNKPVNVFVATFIGSPPMNILTCDIISKDQKVKIKIDNEIYLDCPENFKDLFNNKSKVYLGIRAEDLKPVEKNTIDNNDWFFSKEIDLAEPLGTETQLFFHLNGKEIISRMYNPYPVSIGDKINFQIDTSKIHFFDIDTEKTLF